MIRIAIKHSAYFTPIVEPRYFASASIVPGNNKSSALSQVSHSPRAWAKPLVDKERAIGKWAWIEALKVVAEHIDDNGNIDPEFGKDIKRYVEARK